MSEIHFGAGQPLTSLSAALAAAANGDTIISHGPHTDTVPTVVWTKNNITWKHAGGDYTFDGLAATLDWLRITGAGNRLILERDSGRVKAKRYGRYVLWVSGIDNVIEDPYLENNGYAAAGNCYHIRCTAEPTILRPVINIGTDNNASHFGITLDGCGGGTITSPEIVRLQSTAAGGAIVGIRSINACGRPTVTGAEIRDCVATNDFTGVSFGGAGAGDCLVVDGLKLHDNSGGGTVLHCHQDSRGISLTNFEIIGGGSDVGILCETAAAFLGAYCRVRNGVVYGCQHGIHVAANPVGAAPNVRNCIVRNCSGRGYWSSGTAQPDSDCNISYSNGTETAGWVVGPNDKIGQDPGHTNAAGGDFTLLYGALAIDAGQAVSGRSADILGAALSGAAWDIGPYEYQWSWPLWEEQETYALPGQYQQSTYLKDFCKALIGAVAPKAIFEDLYEVLVDVGKQLWVNYATGKQLDRIGAIVGQQRGGLSDADYRLRILIKAAINTGNGLTEQIIQAFQNIFHPQMLRVRRTYAEESIPHPHQSSHVIVALRMAAGADPLPNDITDQFQPIAAGGVTLWVVSAEDKQHFGWVDDPQAGCFDEVNGAGVREGIGGVFADIYPHDYEV
jgi:hypothetical protein